MPGDEVYLHAIEDRRRELQAMKKDAERHHDQARAKQLQSQLDELEDDYGSIIKAAVLT
jgi:hypothetical protein